MSEEKDVQEVRQFKVKNGEGLALYFATDQGRDNHWFSIRCCECGLVHKVHITCRPIENQPGRYAALLRFYREDEIDPGCKAEIRERADLRTGSAFVRAWQALKRRRHGIQG